MAFHQGGNLVNEVRGVGTEEVAAQYLAAFRIRDNLAPALALAKTKCLAVRAVLALAAAYGPAGELALVFAETDGGSFRKGENGCRYDAEVYTVVRIFPEYAVQSPLALEAGHVGKHHFAPHIPYGINVRIAGAHTPVRDYALRTVFHPSGFQVQGVHPRTASNSHQHLVGLYAAFLVLLEVVHPETAVLSGANGLHCRRGLYAYALLAQLLLEPLGKVCVETRQYIPAVFDHCDFGAEAAEDGGEFKAYNTGSDYAETARYLPDIQQFA